MSQSDNKSQPGVIPPEAGKPLVLRLNANHPEGMTEGRQQMLVCPCVIRPFSIMARPDLRP